MGKDLDKVDYTNEQLQSIASNNWLCEEKPSILFYRSKHFCKMLYADERSTINSLMPGNIFLPNGHLNQATLSIFSQVNPKFILNSYRAKSKYTCSNNSLKSTTLVGYYIVPQLDVRDNNTNNYFIFYPVWLHEMMNNGYIEIISTTAYTISHSAVSINPPPGSTLNNSMSVFALGLNAGIPVFNHKKFQFSFLYDYPFETFRKAFISRHELYLISQHSEYIGIVGARISSGNVLAEDPSNPELYRSCNEDYFTYRFIGFNKVRTLGVTTTTATPASPLILIDSSSAGIGFGEDQLDYADKVAGLKVLELQKVNHTVNRSGAYAYMPAIPTETWANPCPPMWDAL